MDNKEEIKVEEQVFGSPIDNGKTKDLKASVNEMQTFLDEPKNNKSNKGAIIVIIILLVLFLGLGSYVVYDKVFNKPCTKCDVKTEMTAKEKFEKYVSKLDEREYADRVVFETDSVENNILYILGTDNKLYIYDDDGTEIPGASSKMGKSKGKYTEISDVVRMHKVSHSNGTGSTEDEMDGLLLVKKDGSTSIIKNPTKDELKEESLEYKYIIDTYTIQDHRYASALIDIDGNITILK